MRYFTKDWYNDTVLAEMCFQIKPSHKADKLNEKYFQSLYDAQKSWHLKNEKRLCKYTGKAFDKDAAEAEFKANFEENLAYIKEKLPPDIISSVADVRLLAIGTASYEVRDAIVRFCGQVNRRCEKAKSDYESENERLAESIGWYKVNSLNMIQGVPIASAEMSGEDFIITTAGEDMIVSCKVTLTNARIESIGENLIGSYPLYIELLPSSNEGELELNLLCSTEDGKSVELSVTARDIETLEIEKTL